MTDDDVGALLPNLGSILSIVPQSQHILARGNARHLQLIDDVDAEGEHALAERVGDGVCGVCPRRVGRAVGVDPLARGGEAAQTWPCAKW